ncbi:MAG: nitroreductase family protein [Rhodoferax sp.]|uniref:nitroreductase family protein n=1 Tax=Rhodoferax sp. TaxID=50421 RepID=UPI0027347ACE|nr:nitroreductase family protein [Rhodoferax sp.]MDP2679612.1 nitroreductase family protein [Rhodoferax sp.]
MSEMTQADSDLTTVQSYHERTKHRLNGYAAGPDTLDWDAQPDPFRRYVGAPLTPLPLTADKVTTPWADLFEPGHVVAQPITREAIGLLFELSFALSAWKQYGPDRWAMRINPSSGNLHPTEAWLVGQGVTHINDGVHHYAPREHALEQRATFAQQPHVANTTTHALVALSSIQWREAWKYGERAFRYCQLDVGHAIGALRYAAAVLGWRLQPVASGTAQLASLLGLDRDADFGSAEHEEPDALFEVLPGDTSAVDGGVWDWPVPTNWQGVPNRLDRHPMYRWPVVDAVAVATRVHAVPPSLGGRHGAERSAARTLPDLPRSTQSAVMLIRQRRSAQHFDARAHMPVDQLWLLLRALHPARLPFDAWPDQPRVHVLLFAHRVDGLAPGAYLLPRSGAGGNLLRQTLPATLALAPVADAPVDAPLLRLAENPALAGTLRTLNCHQALGSDAILGFALLAEFNPLPSAAAYRQRFQEAGLIGQVLYLEAEALGLRGTGIGCYFDDALHQLIGLPEPAAGAPLQSVYHFTVGVPLLDDRIITEPPYAHLLSEKRS